ncbi:MAG: twin-arginine translocase TatA/TatE family subunit [Acidimicrobiales bacterium]|nr:twin-arginine translocase TatA/TatE family subunit [Acidimicrobiales bacterium]
MGNVGGGEIVVILILGLLVLGPTRLAVVAQNVGRLVGQFRRVASGFQEELQDLVEDPSIEALARERGRGLTSNEVIDGGSQDGD